MNATLAPAMPSKELPPLSKRLRQLRQAAGLSQMQLAVKAELSLSLVVHLEQGQRDDIKLSTAAALAAALGVTVNDLLDEVPPVEEEKPTPKRKRKE